MANESRRYEGEPRRWDAVIEALATAIVIPVMMMPVQAAEEPETADEEITITVLEEGATPADIMSIIELPEASAEEGVEASEKGLDTANRNRERAGERADERAGNRPETPELPEAAEAARERAEVARDQAGSAADDASEEIRDRVGSRDVENLPDDVRERLPDDLPDPDDRPQPPPPPGGNGG